MTGVLGGAIGLVGALGLAVTLVRTTTRTSRTQGQDVAAADQPPGDGQRELEMLRAQVAYLKEQLAANEARCSAPLAEAAPARPAVIDENRKAPPRSPPPTTGGGHPDDAVVALAARALAEPVDPTWAVPTERALWERGAALQPLGSVDRVHCGQELCRVDVHHGRDPGAAAHVSRWVESLENFSSERVLETDAAGQTTTVWLARAGRSIPIAGGGEQASAPAEGDLGPN